MTAAPPPKPVIAGFMRLTDCAPLLVAAKMGFAAKEGIDLVLHRETSWATIRDKISVGHIDVAHMLAPMPIAQNLGITPLSSSIIVPMALGFGSNTVTASRELFSGLEAQSSSGRMTVAGSARAFAATVRSRAEQGKKTVLGIVHPHSAHHYELAYWMASAGIVPGRDVELVALPPSLMAEAIAAEQIDGFCAGEPWGSVAVARRLGRIVTTKGQIWRSSPEKVLGVSKAWADRNQDTLTALIRAIYRAASWCDDAANRRDLVALLSGSECLDLPPAVLEPALLETPNAAEAPDRMIFADKAATFPWISHALWFYAQMVRWGHLARKPSDEAIVRATFRPDLYRAALAPLRVAMPSANSKVEGSLKTETPVGSAEGRLMLGPDGFFDGRIFDPDFLDEYIRHSAV